jgi:hypothetical protein
MSACTIATGAMIFSTLMTFVAYRPHFGGDSQARTPPLVWTSYIARDRYSTGRISYVYKYQLATQVEQIDNKQCFHNHFMYTCLLRTTALTWRSGK